MLPCGLSYARALTKAGFWRSTRVRRVDRGQLQTPEFTNVSGILERSGTMLGASATNCLERGESGVLVGLVKDDIVTTSLAEVVSHNKTLDPHLLELARILAT
jgi:hypothetical protein